MPTGTGAEVGNGEMGRGGRLIALRLIQYAPLFLASIVVARALGPVGRAQYAVPLAAAWVALALCHLSIGPAAVRLLARGDGALPELTSNLVASMLALSAVAAAGTIAFGLAARDVFAGAGAVTIVLAAASIPFLMISQVVGQLLVATGDIRAYTWSAIAGGVVQLAALIAWSAVATLRPESAMAIALIGFAAMALPMLALLARRAGARALLPRVERQLARRLLTNGIAMHPAGVALQLGTRLDLLVVGALMTARATGLYSLALTLADTAFLATQTLSLSALHAQTIRPVDAAIRYTTSFARQTLTLAVLTSLAAAAVAYPFIVLVFGARWRGSVAPFVVLVVAGIGLAVEEPVRQLLQRLARPSVISLVAVLGLVLNVAATLALIPPLGVVGAALGSVVGYWAYAYLIVRLFARTTGVRRHEIFSLPRRHDAVMVAVADVFHRLGLGRQAT
jgi:O-antigen/teichoic acid export membrane protein